MSAAATAASFVTRVLAHEAVKKGAATAVAGAIVAVISEAIWPSA